ncbi:amidase domain-containing protein [Lentibacillus sp. Marseille-P4043]|uniref:amidase domain-containing protein n=1 Tax=Lentibacillus sp. Marseille-P4043 TaxID=2040293 RepID=UPI000D0B3CBE|nr:amidase domain-containing protein [Lentibacillus sp. Marseille-P4043]
MEKLAEWWLDFLQSDRNNEKWWEQKKLLCKERGVEISRIQGKGHIFQKLRYDHRSTYQYLLHLSFLMKQDDFFYREEQVLPLQFRLNHDYEIEHLQMERQPESAEKSVSMPTEDERNLEEYRFSYDRLAVVKYAERWWNSYNPAYRTFNVDCTNYVSQCLYAGGAPMWGAPDRGRGWWYQNGNDNWSYSWSVAHSLRWYLSGSTQGLKGKELQTADELMPGDVICYDFEGDGRWNHNTIVVAKDANGMPLVNAHTSNSRNRYWSYEDSTAWTPKINYKFFRIGE